LKHHDPCLAHGPSAPRDCWRQLWGGVIADGPYPDLYAMAQEEGPGHRDFDPQVLMYTFIFELRPDQQARVICGTSALMDDDVPPMEAFATCLIWERG
jgi:hypothetical protein